MSAPALLGSISALGDIRVARCSGSSAVVTATVSSNKKLRKLCKRSVRDWFHSVEILDFPVPKESAHAPVRSKRARDGAAACTDKSSAKEGPQTTSVSFKWTVAPGLFAGGVVDVMTLAMIKCLAAPHSGSRNLDFACGSGIITKWLLLAEPSCHVVSCDNDTVALEVARINNPTAESVLSDSWDTTPEHACFSVASHAFNNIYSNPPLHRGEPVDSNVHFSSMLTPCRATR
jgi:16S rRNA G1207 methylase RsmC